MKLKQRSLRQAFTLVELLVVISIIAILAGLLFAGVGTIYRSRDRAKTLTILSVVSNALEATAMTRGGSVAGVPHPFAGSAPTEPEYHAENNRVVAYAGTRPLYYRDVDGVSTALSTDGLAVSSDLRDGDRFADPAMPHLFGLERRQLRILGSACELTSARLRLVAGSQELQVDQLTRYKFGGSQLEYFRHDSDDRGQPIWERSTDQAVASALGTSMDRLGELGAIRYAEMSDPLILGGRARRDTSDDSAGSGSHWQAGRVRTADGEWEPYLLRGATLVDAWGTEILVGIDREGRTSLLSAGIDRSFVLQPGEGAETIETIDPFAAIKGQLIGEDVRAWEDNLRVTEGTLY